MRAINLKTNHLTAPLGMDAAMALPAGSAKARVSAASAATAL